MKTHAKRLAAILVAAVMTAAIAIPAFADEAAAITEMTFKKTVETADETYQPRETFSFTVTPQAPVTDETAGDPAIEVFKGVEGGVSVSRVTTDPTKSGTQTYSTGKFTFTPSVFTKPGIYKYLVHENNNSDVTPQMNPDMTFAGDQYLYVYVKNASNGGMEVYAASLVDASKTGEEAKAGEFTNIYKKNGGNGDDFHDLTIQKKVEGALGDTEKEFEFTLKITSSDRTRYMATKTAADGKTTVVEIPSDGVIGYIFKLKSTETLKVENLSSSDKYTIIETEAGQDGYTTTYSNNNGETSAASNRAMAADKDITETITNTRNSVTPTGIFMSYGPYIAMIAAAAVLAFVFLRKREEI